jgi:hypothetical protein
MHPNRSSKNANRSDTLLAVRVFSCFGPRPVTRLGGVRIFDLGQGGRFGVLNQDGEVVLYVDYGGIVDDPDKSRPSCTGARLNVQSIDVLVPIVLTHWDKEHCHSAKKRNPLAQQSQWLVPTQKVSPQAAVFSATLTNAYRWPEKLGQTPVRFRVGREFALEIRKCSVFEKDSPSESRDQTGLAITLIRMDENGNDESVILFPGDCAFDRIPNLPNAPLRAILACGDGSKHKWSAPQTEEAITNVNTPSMTYPCDKDRFGYVARNACAEDGRVAATAPEILETRARTNVEYEDMVW